jgi:hypothetical protein
MFNFLNEPDQAKSNKQFKEALKKAREIFIAKNKDYGDSWKVLRFFSDIDQIFIKILRIRSIQSAGKQMVEDSLEGDFIGALNYSILTIEKLNMDKFTGKRTPAKIFDHWSDVAFELFQKKNHDYGEAWRDMRISSMTDLSLAKVIRIKQMEDPKGSEVSEGYEAGLLDIINYVAFCLILMNEGVNPMD